MFNYSVKFSAIDNVSRSIRTINRKLRKLSDQTRHATGSIRSDFNHVNTSIGRMATTTRTASTQMNASLGKVNQGLKRVKHQADRTGRSIAGIRGANVAQHSTGRLSGGSLGASGSKALLFGGLSSFALYQPLKVAGEYETAFKDVKKAVEGTPEQFAKMRKEMMAFQGASFSDISKVASEAGKMGLSATNVMGFTSTIIKGATALDFGATSAVNSIGKIMTMTNQMDAPNVAASAIMNRVAHLENSMPGVKAGGVLDIWGRSSNMYSQLGFNNNQMAGMSAFLEQNSVSSELGASSFLTMMNKFKATNGEFGFFSRIKNKGLEGLADVMGEIAELSGSEQQKIFGSDAMKLIGKMLNKQTFAKLGNATNLAGNSTGAVDKEWGIFRNTYEQRTKDLSKTVRVLLASIGDPMRKMAIDTINFISPTLKLITTWVQDNKRLVGIILKVIGVITALIVAFGAIAIIVSGATFIFGGVVTAVGFLTSGVGLLSAAFGILSTVAVAFFSALQVFVLANPITAIFALSAAVIIYYWDEITAGINVAIEAVTTFVDYLGNITSFGGVLGDIKSFFGFDDKGGINNADKSNIELTLKADAGTSGRVSGGRNGVKLRTVGNDMTFGNAL